MKNDHEYPVRVPLYAHQREAAHFVLRCFGQEVMPPPISERAAALLMEMG